MRLSLSHERVGPRRTCVKGLSPTCVQLQLRPRLLHSETEDKRFGFWVVQTMGGSGEKERGEERGHYRKSRDRILNLDV